MRDLEAQKRLTKEARDESMLDQNHNIEKHIINSYYIALEEYYAISLKNH